VVENVLRRFIGWPSREPLAGGRELLLSCIVKVIGVITIKNLY